MASILARETNRAAVVVMGNSLALYNPPIWVPGLGSLETWQWVAERGYVYSYLSYSGYRRGKRMMDGYWDALDQLGYDANPYRAGFAQGVVVADSDNVAEKEYWEHV